jgi:flavin-dependent dehydrogenase
MTPPTIIVGGGLAGAAAGILLARSGHSVTLIERQTGPTDKICGEFLSREAQLHLQRLGLDLAGLGGHRITHLRLVIGASSVRVSLPFAGMGLSRRVLDEALLNRAVSAGAELLRGQTARISGTAVSLADHQVLQGGPVLLATGKHDLRGRARSSATEGDDLVGFKTYFTLNQEQAKALSGHVEVILFGDGYAGLQMVEAGRSNLCLLVKRSRLQRVGYSWKRLLDDLCSSNAHLRERLDGAVAEWEKPLAIYRVPYGFVHGGDDSVFRLGDQVGVIDSFSGDGMSIALHSAALAASAVSAGDSAASYHRRVRRDISGQIRRARWLYHLGQQHPAPLLRLARLWPGSLRIAARLTRVPEHALKRGFA